MRLKVVVPSSVECSLAPPSSLFASRKHEMQRSVSLAALSNPFLSKTPLQSHNLKKSSKLRGIRRSCSANLDDIHRDEPSFRLEGFAKISGRGDSLEEHNLKRNKKVVHYAVPNRNTHDARDRDSFLNSRFDFLEPMMLGIKPEFSDWPDHETVTWATIEHKAKSLEIPLSMRMIKKKLKSEEGLIDSKESPGGYCSLNAAFASMAFIIVELQSSALKMRESLCHEDLHVISSQVQKEMHSSFVWLFQRVFFRTPALMVDMMVLLADFGVYSASNISMEYKTEEKPVQPYPQISSSILSLNLGTGSGIGEKTQIGDSVYQGEKLESEVEMSLWNSLVDEAAKMREGVDEEVIDHEMKKFFVSPVSVELEPDGYEDYLRTDLLYQMNLSQEPNNSLLLCNYAQFLNLVAHDYDRAEECFKRAVQVLPPDAESLSQYAIFLWTVRKDFWEAEQRFIEALSIEPDNSYYASRYANFLWNTGGEETCFPINNSQTLDL